MYTGRTLTLPSRSSAVHFFTASPSLAGLYSGYLGLTPAQPRTIPLSPSHMAGPSAQDVDFTTDKMAVNMAAGNPAFNYKQIHSTSYIDLYPQGLRYRGLFGIPSYILTLRSVFLLFFTVLYLKVLMLSGRMHLAVCRRPAVMITGDRRFASRPRLWVKMVYTFIRYVTIFHAGYVLRKRQGLKWLTQ